MTRSDPKH